MDKKFIFGIIVAILLLMPLVIGTDVTLAEGENKSVIIGEKEHVIKLVSLTEFNGLINVDGLQKTMSKGQSAMFPCEIKTWMPCEIKVKVDDIFYATKEIKLTVSAPETSPCSSGDGNCPPECDYASDKDCPPPKKIISENEKFALGTGLCKKDYKFEKLATGYIVIKYYDTNENAAVSLTSLTLSGQVVSYGYRVGLSVQGGRYTFLYEIAINKLYLIEESTYCALTSCTTSDGGIKCEECIEVEGGTECKYCKDSDGGKNYYTRGNASTSQCVYYTGVGGCGASKPKTDTCDGEVLTEYYCDGIELKSINYTCPYGCSNGACLAEKPVTTECTDTDGGKDYYTKGATSAPRMGTTYDACYNGAVLVEAYCLGDGIKTEEYNCLHGCSNGVCLKEAPTPPTEEEVQADLGAYPAPFVQNGVADVTIIYGADAPAVYMETVSLFTSSLASQLVTEGSGKLGDVIMTDAEAEASKPLTNLIIVGGANINRISAQLGGVAYPTSGEDITAIYGYKEGEALLKFYASPYSAGKKALLVAGWTGISTREGAYFLIHKTTYLHGTSEKLLTDLVGVEEEQTAFIAEKEESITEEEEGNVAEEALKEKLKTGECMGCLHDTTCLPFGQRLKIEEISSYCSIDGVFRPQMPIGAECENDYECSSNECGNGKCISTYSLLQKIFELLKTIFGKGWLWGK